MRRHQYLTLVILIAGLPLVGCSAEPSRSADCAGRMTPITSEGDQVSYHWDEIREGKEYEWFQEGTVTVIEASGHTAIGRQMCRYFGDEYFDGNITWSVAPLRTASTTSAAPPTSLAKPPSVPRGCDSAMKAASEVSLDRDNEAELDATARACPDVDSWVAALRKHPDAIGLPDLSPKEITTVLVLTCNRAPTTDLCVDAAAKGLWES